MMPPRTVVGTLSHVRVPGGAWGRRAIFIALIALLMVFGFFPQRYRAAVTLTPSDPSNLGFNTSLTQLGALNSVFGNQASVEIALKIASSTQVRETVSERLHLRDRLHFKDDVSLQRWLERAVEIRSLRGGIIQMETLQGDPVLAKDLVQAYEEATREQLADINRRQTSYKRDYLFKLITDASDRLDRAQAAFDTFRLQTRNPDPTSDVESSSARILSLERAIKAKEIELAASREYYTPENLQLRQIQVSLSQLRGQLAQAHATSPLASEGVGRAVVTSTRYKQLQRELSIAQSLYDSYKKFLDSTSVEDVTSTANMRILEPPFVDTDRQLNYPPLAIALALFMLWMAIEFYGLQPPIEERVITRRELHA